MPFLVLLTDRFPASAMPALEALRLDLKTEPLAMPSLDHLRELGPEAVLVDAAENPAQGFALCRELRARDPRVPVVALVERDQLAGHPWHEVTEDFLYPGAPELEIRTRLAMLRSRHGAGDGSVIRLGPLAIDTDSYRVTAAGRTLDLTFKEFELLRFLAQRPGRVHTRPGLLREVWGYDFYGGTRTVDVHVRRLRAKLGPEHEHLIETVRGVGYRAAEPED
ncbi:MAG: response regulator transcription factor [Actinobacteria bacterium]|nr:response regulator transcription factor [Actinomycetota bacterium]